MSEESTVPGGDALGSGGTDENKTSQTIEETSQTPKDGDLKSALAKAVTQSKNRGERLKAAEEELAALRAEKKTEAEQKMRENEQFRELAELREKESEEAKAELNSLRSEISEARKFNSVLEAIPGRVDQKYWALLQAEVDKVVVNPDTGFPDEVSVKEVAESFKQKYSDIIVTGDDARIPSDAARQTKAFSMEDYASMSIEDKKKNLPELVKRRLKEL